MNDLSIFIPTYNRPSQLLNTLLRLSGQIIDKTIIYVLDNASSENLHSYCTTNASINNLINENKIVFIRHNNNIGMSANFLRAFELCNSEWMWLIADDDSIYVDAINTITQTIAKLKNNPDVSFVKFKSKDCCHEVNNSSKDIKSLEEFISTLSISKDYFNSYIFLSNGLYRMPSFKNRIEVGYKYLNTYVPHLLMLVDELYYNKSSFIYLSEHSIVDYIQPKIGYSYGMVAGLGVGAFKNFIYHLEKEQYMQLENVFACHNDYKVSIDIFYQAKYSSSLFVAKRLIDNYYLQIKNSRSILHNTMYKIFNSMIMYPMVFELIIKILRRYSSAIDEEVIEMLKRYEK
jgi:glycosyltransferase involved in cell wall biosynthesis